ncbi:TPA: flagellar motor switch phosphatase FliY [Bacillus thuringiensis]|uniref:Flagellar motor switch phosphatase FliY n=2 Tax=Bacillus cereus group TaxID=86661 RepID=A0A643MGN7_BACTU|nr:MULTISPECIES: flagellar motor switch protein [Bacillus]AGE77444.1 CheC, inhibitor of MCP methylation [Bacillus thuringiensis serovar kurstaki str. HD73]AHZ50587.1 flagellar motor switch protein [Bacillus thuringiensis serovar kurstaki str. YBT-1520]AIE32985.1 flagellar motor switch protein [Bacillus thuringiensis serovar kurstaki str. HD-1]AIM32809.1 CheC, inhibitor of MCP methylation [Bacillus thuringiensis serovar kurstaki str. YBT-1520]AJK41473.1 cheC-like family protein [Bacillus thurin
MPEQHTKGDTSTIVLEKENEHLTPQECDILGEIANISFGSASTVLSTILNRQVSITAPRIELVDLYDSRDVEVPHVVLNIHFTKGLDMENLLVLKQDVALSIADLMMMGTGEVEDGKELGELELSAVQEAMNQMMGFAATSMSEFFQDTVDMSPPTIKVVKLSEEMEKISEIDGNHTIVKVSFDLKIDNLVNSKLVQIVSVEHAKQMVNKLMQLSGGVEETDEPAEVVETEIVEEKIEKEHLTQEEKDVLGEIANISIGSASTVLSTLLNQPVSISTPNVEAINVRHYDGVPVPFVILNVDFVEGLKNENVFVFTKDVALTMVDLMMMGTGEVDPEKELTELELSGIKEIMNQMMGHAATAMSEMFQEKMDMTPPNVKFVTLKEEMEYLGESMEVDELVQITFNLEIGDLLQSKMYQILPISEAKEMVRRLLYPMVEEEEIATEEIEEEKIVEPVVQPIEFKEVKQMEPVYMDTSILQNVEMNVKFVFGSTVKTIQDILSLQENEAVVLDEDIDEPIRIYVNDVLVAYGELVNVDGFFGVKVTKSL